MGTLKGLFEEAQRGNDLIVTQPHSRWLELPEDEQVYSPEAIKFVSQSLRKEFKHERPGRFSPSAMGECPRRIVFGYAGAAQLAPDLDNQEMMDHGSWGHLKWQAEGLTVGYMKEAEVWVHNEELRCGGSMDATLEDGSNFELKTAGHYVYQRVVGVEGWPKYENLLQDATYKLLADIDMSSIVYENRSSGQFHEYRVPRDTKLEKDVIVKLTTYSAYVDADELPPVLDMCSMRMGSVYKRCPFRSICLEATSVSQFGQVS